MHQERPQLLGRAAELAELDGLLRELREGRSRVLVLRGEAGVGKSVLLDLLAERAAPWQTVRAAGVEDEAEFAYAALQRLCAPLLPGLDRLPPVQQEALRVAFGLSAGPPPEMLLVGLAVLGLFAEAAAEAPLLCLVDDAQWLDLMSERILAFVGRRLDAEAVGLVFAERTTGVEGSFGGLPELVLRGLPDAEARALLDRVLPGPVDDRVRDRIVAETGGNPLALLELPRGLAPAELAFGFGGPGAGPLATRVEDGFRRRVEALPADTRALLLLAALEPVGDGPLLWQALRLLGIGPEAAAPAEAAGLITLGASVRFRHPLVRSAAWRGAAAAELRSAHRALAEATDAGRDPDRHAWHRAHAAAGPEEEAAAALERSADRALARGGRAAAAAFLERAAALSPDPKALARRALAAATAQLAAGLPARVPDLLAAAELGSLDPWQQADAARLRARALASADPGAAAVGPLLEAAARFADLDPVAARGTCLAAFAAALWAGRAEPGAVRRVAVAAAALPTGEGPAGEESAREEPVGEEPVGVLLRALEGWARAGEAERREAWSGFAEVGRAVETSEGAGLAGRLTAVEADPLLRWLVAQGAAELGDLRGWLAVTERAVRVARESGAFSVLSTAAPEWAAALLFAGRFVEAGELLARAAPVEEVAGAAARSGVAALLGAYRGQERAALELIEAAEREGARRGLGRLTGLAAGARALLHNGLGNYPAALAAARRGVEYRDFGLQPWLLGELVEAAVRAGEPEAAAQARGLLADRAGAGTPWALGSYALARALTGESGGVEEQYREAVARFAEGGLAPAEARARLLYGEWLRRQNRRGQAREELRAAHEAVTVMGLEAFAERARRELLATGETVRKRVVGAPVLTPQEAQIARLAAGGHPNAEIGAQLFLSPRTVEWHLRKVFTKLGITSRREIEGALAGA
ncbi:LuxR family transcriptional regulator [Kitasatospora sp. MMS16-BH015]|uniref:helix-turn-helix transcriptional regulator n=1 Tax=Kitasatospora sp. MMS16-BH015 TaxID=2018025 RepID=UPI000CA3970C|nr:LuxR family transcriptional regulator [Kitasatospora sp. MMS16-BH015]AUG81492.1 LuxR family transcriptional regulator [Kitasatospora sp. MMS16-BH015]